MDDMKLFVDTYLSARKSEPLRILDLGSMEYGPTYRQFFQEEPWTYIGLDIAPGKNVDLVLEDGYHWKEVKNESADIIISGQAFEHIEYFWLTMSEIAKALKPGGLCCIIAPSGGPEHRYPVDCWRIYPDGLRAMAKYAGLDVLEARTQWEPKGYPDDSDTWANSVLVAQKGKNAGGEAGDGHDENAQGIDLHTKAKHAYALVKKNSEIDKLKAQLDHAERLLAIRAGIPGRLAAVAHKFLRFTKKLF
jgi:SAM-dependent methyltransferase